MRRLVAAAAQQQVEVWDPRYGQSEEGVDRTRVAPWTSWGPWDLEIGAVVGGCIPLTRTRRKGRQVEERRTRRALLLGWPVRRSDGWIGGQAAAGWYGEAWRSQREPEARRLQACWSGKADKSLRRARTEKQKEGREERERGRSAL